MLNRFLKKHSTVSFEINVRISGTESSLKCLALLICATLAYQSSKRIRNICKEIEIQSLDLSFLPFILVDDVILAYCISVRKNTYLDYSQTCILLAFL